MSEQNKPARYNPYKAAHQIGGRNDPRIAQAWEQAKTEAPNLYRKHEQMQSYFTARRPIIDAMLDDPEVIAMLDDLAKRAATTRHNAFIEELALLDVEAGATKREIRNAYRRKARKLHPDAGGDDAAFKQLHTAYRRLLAVAHA